jgi:hypothetical protein
LTRRTPLFLLSVPERRWSKIKMRREYFMKPSCQNSQVVTLHGKTLIGALRSCDVSRARANLPKESILQRSSTQQRSICVVADVFDSFVLRFPISLLEDIFAGHCTLECFLLYFFHNVI